MKTLPPRKRNLRAGSLAKKIFNDLIASLENFEELAANPSGILCAGGLSAYRDKQEIKELGRERAALRRLREQKLIAIQKRGGRMEIHLTEKGVVSALREKIASSKSRLPKGQLCYVSFDIPQRAASLRSLLRLVLKKSRFGMLHQSLWASDYDVGKLMALLVRHLKAEDWIHVFTGTILTRIEMKK